MAKPRFHEWPLPYIAMAVLVAAALLLISRSFFGVGFWSDEAYSLSTTMRFHLGDRPLVDSWDTNFSSAILALPFLKTFLALTGSTEGILLAFRGVWVVLALATMICAFLVLKDLLSLWPAVIVSAMPALIPFGGYGGDWLWITLSALAALRLFARPPRRAVWHALPGALCALGVIAFPPTVTVVPFFALGLWLAYRKKGTSALLPVTGYLAGGLAVGLVFLAVLRWLSGPAMFSMLSQVMSPDDHDFGLAAQLIRLGQAKAMLIGPVIAGAVLGLALLKSGPKRRVAITSLAVALGVAGAVGAVATGRVYLLIAPQALVFIVAMTLLSLGLTALRDRLRPEQMLLALPAVGAGIGWFLGSNAGWGAALLGSPLLLAAALFWWSADEDSPGGGNPSWPVATAGAMLLALLIAVSAVSLLAYPEGAITTMTSRVASGPFKGVFTTPQAAAQQEDMIRTLDGLPRAPGRTTFFERFPIGYLLDGVRPGTYSTWVTSAESGRFQTYVDLTGNAPSRIVLTRFRADLRDGAFPSGVVLRDFASDYALVFENQDFRVFDLTTASN